MKNSSHTLLYYIVAEGVPCILPSKLGLGWNAIQYPPHTLLTCNVEKGVAHIPPSRLFQKIGWDAKQHQNHTLGYCSVEQRDTGQYIGRFGGLVDTGQTLAQSIENSRGPGPNLKKT